jgi:hypothetical protein
MVNSDGPNDRAGAPPGDADARTGLDTVPDGTVLCCLELPAGPSLNELVTPVGEDGEATLRVMRWPDGHLSGQVVSGSGQVVAEGDSQPYVLSQNETAAYMFAWSQGKVRFFINGIALPSFLEEPTPLIIHSPLAALNPKPSFECAEAVQVCEGRIVARSERYRPAAPRPGHLRVPEHGELRRLRDATNVLRDAIQGVTEGRGHQLGVVALGIRTLVDQQFDRHGAPKRTSQPLLLRVAARLGLPLPVFANRNSPADLAELEEITGQSNFSCHVTPARTRQTCLGERLCDIEDWLDEPAMTPLNGPLPKRTVGQLLSATANKFGFAHYDPELPDDLHRLNRNFLGGASILERLLFVSGQTVLELAEWVLRQAEDKSSG